MSRVPVILDVDTGIDDALALLYACASPEVELLAVTCVSGNIEARQVAENTRAVLELAGRGDVEVALGRDVPLVRPLVVAPETHGPRGLGYAELPAALMPVSQRHAADLIIEEASRRPGEVTLVTLGPLTNVAVAVLREPLLPRLLKRLVMMAGSYRSPGNTAPTTEWNVHVDPEAASVVLSAFGAPELATRPVALGLDVTERAKLTQEHLDLLADRVGLHRDGWHGSRTIEGLPRDPSEPSSQGALIVRFLADALRFYMEFHSRYDGFYGAFIHDPLALAVALDPTLARLEALRVEIELGGTLTTGETVADWRRTWGKTPNLDVAVEVDADRFIQRYIELVGDWLAKPGSDGGFDEDGRMAARTPDVAI